MDYNVCMQIFRYMVYIWDAYEKEEEQKQKGISKRAGFKYPVILPIVYYEGAVNWTVPRDFKSRLQQGEAFGKYVPVEEAEDLAGKVREKKMGMLFENMQKMDIQEERRKTKAAEQKAEEAVRSSIRLFVESCQELGISQTSIMDKLVAKYDLDMDAANQAIANYWKTK